MPAIRKSKWIWDGLAGTEEEALRAEAALGREAAIEIRALTAPVEDATLVGLANEVCQRLTACVRENRRHFQCEVIQDNSPHALALPGGLVFVSNSLCDFCERHPDELAFVIGHEMAHVIRGHVWERMLNETTLRVVSAISARAGGLGVWFRQKGIGLLRSAYTSESELEADELGWRLAAAAGFAPSGSVAFLQRIGRLRRTPAELGQYFGSHPPAAERLGRLALLVRQVSA